MTERTWHKSIPVLGVIGLTTALVGWFLLPYSPLRTTAGFTQLAAIDPIAACVLAVTAVSASIGVVLRRRRDKSFKLLAVAAIAALIVSCLFVGRILGQGLGDGRPPAAGDALRIVSWNAGGVAVSEISSRVEGLVAETNADIVVLPETGWKTGESVNGELATRGQEFTIFDWEGTASSVLMRPEMVRAGGYRAVTSTMPPWAGLEVAPAEPSAAFPIVIAAHFQQGSIGSTATWRAHLQWAASICDGTPYVIIVGDTNSTLNQLGGTSIGSCQDVAAAIGSGAAATWPSWAPSLFGVSIDRFLVGSAWNAASQTFEVRRDVSEQGQDHWPIVVSLK